MFENISILIVSSSNKSIDIHLSLLKAKILSKQRPNVACLSCKEFNDEMNLKSFMETFVSKKLTQCRNAIEEMRKMNEFNQLEIWKNEVNKRRITSRIKNVVISKLCMLKSEHEKNPFNMILDSPNENDFYLIIFDVCDCEIIKSIATLECSNLIGIVNLFPRNENSHMNGTEKSQDFWLKLLKMKHLKDFDNVAFIDLDVPLESNYILNFRSQSIYDQFCYHFYDFEHLKLSYKKYFERLMIHDINVKKDANDFQQLQKLLNKLPTTILEVDEIYEAIIEQIAQDDSSFMMKHSMRKFMEIEAFGKKIYDVNDKLRKGYTENPNFYSQKILNLEHTMGDMWKNVETQQSIEQKQIQNYFMDKIVKQLKCDDKGYDFIKFYFYVLQFKNWHHVDLYEKTFFEIRSVGHKKKEDGERFLKKVTSDTCIEYQNLSVFPLEIEQFMNTRIDSDDVGNFYIQLFSQPAMLQHFSSLTEICKQFSHQYSNIFDVQLVKFPSRSVPKIFSSEIHRKTLSTPLCFRDFNDYMKYETMSEKNIKSSSNFFIEGDDKCPINDFIRESFVLPMSIKSQRKRNNEHCETKNEAFRETIVEQKLENVTGEKEEVYNVCNKRVEFQIEESEFQSFPLYIKATIFTWLNMEKHLNLICTLHDKVQLSYSYDLHTNEFNNVTLRDEHASGMICSIDIGDTLQEKNNMVLSFPHGMIIKIIDVDTVEINWMELKQRSHDMNINNTDGNTETKRTYFSNGFIMIHMLDGSMKIYSCNGTIYEIVDKNGNFKRSSKSTRNDQLTKYYKFSITSIHFLKKYVNISTFVMILPTGNRFIIEHDVIVEELKPLYEVREQENFQIIRDDGLRVFHANSYTKCLYGDETLITKTYYCDDDISTIFDSKKVDKRKSISILDKIWLTEAENESKLLLDDIINFVNDDYFVNVNQHCQVEHKKYGSFRFMKNTIEVKLFNGVTMTCKQSKECSISFNDISFHMNDKKIEFYDEKCSKCSNKNKVLININKIPTDDDDDDDDKCQKKILICASDAENNIFEIEENGRQVFYEKWDPTVCQQCQITKIERNMNKYGERWIVLNRDMSGYEILVRRPENVSYNNNIWMETSDTLLCCHGEMHEINIDKKFHPELKPQNSDCEQESSMKLPLIKSLTKNTSKTKRDGHLFNTKNNLQYKEMKRNTHHSTTVNSSKEINLAEISETLPTTSPRVTVDDSLISSDIVCRLQMIKFYSDPLLDLPEVINVSAYFTLYNNEFTDIIRALRHLRKHSREKFIINVDGLMKTPVETRTFQEHFKFIVKRSIEGYIQDKLELFRKSMARMIFEDILANAFKKFFDGNRSIQANKMNEKGLRADDSSVCYAHPIQNKSFSFV